MGLGGLQRRWFRGGDALDYGLSRRRPLGVEAGIVKATVKKHTIHISEKLGGESRKAATLRVVEALA